MPKCILCKHLDKENLMCYPESEDYEREYKLDKEDLETDARCDFFECIKIQ